MIYLSYMFWENICRCNSNNMHFGFGNETTLLAHRVRSRSGCRSTVLMCWGNVILLVFFLVWNCVFNENLRFVDGKLFQYQMYWTMFNILVTDASPLHHPKKNIPKKVHHNIYCVTFHLCCILMQPKRINFLALLSSVKYFKYFLGSQSVFVVQRSGCNASNKNHRLKLIDGNLFDFRCLSKSKT